MLNWKTNLANNKSSTPFSFSSFPFPLSFSCFSPLASTWCYLLCLQKVLLPLACSPGTYLWPNLWMRRLSSLPINLGWRSGFGDARSHWQASAASSQGLQEGLTWWSCYATKIPCAPSVTLGLLCHSGTAGETLICWQCGEGELWQGIFNCNTFRWLLHLF